MNTMRMDTVARKRVPAALGLVLVWLSVLSVWLIYAVLASPYGNDGAVLVSALAAALVYCGFARIVALRTEAGPRLRLHLTLVATTVLSVVGLIALIAITHRMFLAISA